MKSEHTRTPLLIGVGNVLLGDDGTGIRIVRKIARLAGGTHGTSLRVLEVTGDVSELIDAWRGEEIVFVFDAVSSGSPPGTVHRLDASSRVVTSLFFHGSTHSLGLAEAVELARAFGTLPKRLIVYGVEGKRFDIGACPSREVRRAEAVVAARALREIRMLDRRPDRVAPRAAWS